MTPNITASTMGHLLSRRGAIAAICAAPALATRAFAETRWPRQPVKIIVGLPAGGGTDLLARGLAPPLAAAFGQPFIVENLTGAGGNVAAAAVAHAGDGHTLGIVQGGPTTTAKVLNPMISYDPQRDFKAVSLLTRVPFVLTVNPGSLPAAGFAAWLDHVRAQPGKLNYASVGPGTVTHLAMEELKARLGIDLVHVPYRGFPPATLDLVAGRVQAMFNVPSTALEFIADGRLAALAQTGAARLASLPAIPTLAEAGIRDASFFGWAGMVAPAEFPDDTAMRLSEVMREALRADPATRGGLDRAGNEMLGTPPAELAALQVSEAARWSTVIARLGLTIQP
jgi:tripartite-type tricarboxylate transporter receptor subunit TctC